MPEISTGQWFDQKPVGYLIYSANRSAGIFPTLLLFLLKVDETVLQILIICHMLIEIVTLGCR